MFKHLQSPPPQPSIIRGDLPRALDAVIARALAKNPDDRYQSASEVVRAALRLLETAERDREAALAEVHQKIQLGLDQIQRGEVFDGETVFDELDEEHGS